MSLLSIDALLVEGSCIDMTLYKVTCYANEYHMGTFDVYVYAYNVQQAINIVNEEFRKTILEAHEQKKSLLIGKHIFCVVNQCPICGYEFSDEDYDSYF